MSDTLEQAIAAVKAGDKSMGGQLLNQVLQTDPRNETAWLWMTAVVGSDEERRKILEYVLSINPDNETARNSLAKLKPPASPATGVQVDSPPKEQVEISLQPAHKAEEIEATKKCPYCAETIKAEAIVCRFCGRDLQTGQLPPTAANLNQDANSVSLLLDQHIRNLVNSGWEVVFQTPIEVKLKKPKRLNLLTLFLFVINSLILFILPTFLCIADQKPETIAFCLISQNIFIIITFSGILRYLRKEETATVFTEIEIKKEKASLLEKIKYISHSKRVKTLMTSILAFFAILLLVSIFVKYFPQAFFLALPIAMIIYVIFLYSYSFSW
ncbi:zinc ribbon domain-containing protein [Chloracidobacterium thermophilum]|uniref:zinc ribbon domain-containing protein n=1 Tax=Chloracidobacterium thermophilum TaxID=458033 RepID=UPI000AA240EC|nr:zinc ribbon domain-containing protein [Chloracidobacterium thermophilum]